MPGLIDCHIHMDSNEITEMTLANGVTLCRTCHSDTHSPDICRAFDRVVYNTKLPKWLVDWLRQQDRPAVRIIEEALIEEYKLFPPE